MMVLVRLLCICILLSACNASRQVETRLYFGQSKLDGGMVSEKEWSHFLEQYVARLFPEGSTIENATGNWYDTSQHKLVTEPSRVVVAIGKISPAKSERIDSLRYWYKTLHQQQSVLRVDKKVKARMF